MVKVIVGESESIDHAIYRFRRKCERAGILRQLRRSTYFVKRKEALTQSKSNSPDQPLASQDSVEIMFIQDDRTAQICGNLFFSAGFRKFAGQSVG